MRKATDNIRLDLERQNIGSQRLEEEGSQVKSDIKAIEDNLEKLLSQCKTNFSKIKTKLWSGASGGGTSDVKLDLIDQQMGTISISLDNLKLRLTALEHNFNLAPD